MREITLEELERELSECFTDPEAYLDLYCPYIIWVDDLI